MIMIGFLSGLLRRDEIKKLPNLIADCEEALKEAPEGSDQEYLDDAGEPAYETGLALLNRAKYNLAIVEFTKSLQANPKHRNAKLYRGFARYKLEDDEAAIEEFDGVPRNNSKYTAACFFRGMAHTKLGENDLAIDSFEKAILADPSGKEIYTVGSFNERGKVHHKEGHFDLAIVDFGKVNKTINRVVMPHQLADAVYRRGKARFAKCQFDIAIEDMNKAVKHNPKHPDALHWLGKAHFKEGHFEDAVKFLEDAVKFLKEAAPLCPDTTESDYWYWLARAYMKTQNYGGLIDAVKGAIRAIKKNKPPNKQSHLGNCYQLRGKAHRMIGKFKKAEADDRKAERLLSFRLVGFDDAPPQTTSPTSPPPIDTGDSTVRAA